MSYNLLTGTSYLPATPPAGTIAPYLGTAASGDPAGWVICDGSSRSNSDNRYNNLIGLGIGSGTTGGTYTPPNLKAAFLRGTGTNSTSTYSGPSLKAFQQQQIINHGHSFGNHNHISLSGNTSGYGLPTDGKNCARGWDASTNELNVKNNFLDLETATTSSVTLSAGSDSVRNVTRGSETQPYNYGVNWILKL